MDPGGLLKELGMEAWSVARRELTTGFKVHIRNRTEHVLVENRDIQRQENFITEEDDIITAFDIPPNLAYVLKGRSTGIFRTIKAAIGYDVVDKKDDIRCAVVILFEVPIRWPGDEWCNRLRIGIIPHSENYETVCMDIGRHFAKILSDDLDGLKNEDAAYLLDYFSDYSEAGLFNRWREGVVGNYVEREDTEQKIKIKAEMGTTHVTTIQVSVETSPNQRRNLI